MFRVYKRLTGIARGYNIDGNVKQLSEEIMSKIDWNNAPDWATHIVKKCRVGPFGMLDKLNVAIEIGGKFYSDPQMMEEYDMSEWRIIEERPTSTTTSTTTTTSTSTDILKACIDVQTERGKQYDASGTGERSFAAAAEAFNAITGRDLKGSDVCLILEMVKNVRQYSDPSRLHDDSVLGKVSYASLWAEELHREHKWVLRT